MSAIQTITDGAISFSNITGEVSLFAPSIPSATPLNLTILTSSEASSLSLRDRGVLQSILQDVEALSARGTYHVVTTQLKDEHQVLYAFGSHIRRQLKLTPLPWSLTSSLSRPFLSTWTESQLDALSLTPPYERQASNLLCSLYPSSSKSWIRLGDSYGGKISILAYGRALHFALAHGEEKVTRYSLKHIVRCPTLPPLFTTEEKEELDAMLEDGTGCMDRIVRRHLLRPWKKEVRRIVRDAWLTTPHYPQSSEPRRRLLVCTLRKQSSSLPTSVNSYRGDEYYEDWNELPRFFSPIIPFTLYGMSTPRHAQGIRLLRSIGIETVVTLTEEQPLPERWFDGTCMKRLYLPVENYRAPSVEQFDLFLRRFIQAVEEEEGGVLVHCGGGKGRAGAVLGAYLSLHGTGLPISTGSSSSRSATPAMTATQAIDLLRQLRPESIETTEQEDFVRRVERRAWKTGSILPPLPTVEETAVTSKLEVEGTLPPVGEEVDLLVLVGLPGSGKSWVRERLNRSCQAKDRWRIVSGDDARFEASSLRKGDLESSMARMSSRKTIIDRVNASRVDRVRILSLTTWARTPVTIFFYPSLDLCIQRAQRRSGHPTLQPGNRVEVAIRSFAKMLERPTIAEGWKAVITVRSMEQAEQVVRLLGGNGGEIAFFKFPRTAHLLDLGAVGQDDLVDAEINEKLEDGTELVITEKVDGAQLGFSLSSSGGIRIQNRSHYIHSGEHPQFSLISSWLHTHSCQLQKILGRDDTFLERYILFGEWLVAKHSIQYDRLEDWFYAFDLYDRKDDTWYARELLEDLLRDTHVDEEAGEGIRAVPLILRAKTIPFNQKLKDMTEEASAFYDGKREGVYVKWERNGRVLRRGKVVRADFLAGDEHWSRREMVKNRLRLVGE
ncbi:hypothetical protein BT69DRAFT_1296205 [Atractiella rhizophila]|nr:hypothetical protein BT69DRAFT_1296205 [Atractiella rhizophila]